MKAVEIDLSINQLSSAYIKHERTPSEVIDYVLERAHSGQDRNIWITLLQKEQIDPYLEKLSAFEPADLPLYGIPFAIKDNIDLAGVATTAACAEYSYVPEHSAFAVQLLIDAGAIPIGKTNMDQFATGLVGTRSPYGAVKNAFNPDYISGGSSSGSAVALALGEVSFSLGTDTAGSGRVPAAFNNLIGLKPTRGLISTNGVVPACRSLDSVSLFALNADDAERVYKVLNHFDSTDIYAREFSEPQICTTDEMTIGVPDVSQLEFFANKDYENLFTHCVESIKQQGYGIIPIDFEPFMNAAKLLYQGPWVAERYLAIKEFIETNQEALHPVTSEIILPAKSLATIDAFNSIYELQALKKQADAIFDKVDSILIPTAGTIYRIDEVSKEPIVTNSRLGFYTNFMNLLDYAAIAIPAGFTEDDLPFGVTLFSRAFTDYKLLKHAKLIQQMQEKKMGATNFEWVADVVEKTNPENTIDVAVCGAHLSGMPLNHQLTDRNARLMMQTRTAAMYRFYALAGGPPWRPGLIKDEKSGQSIEVEVWRMPLSQFGSFMQGIPHPLGIGTLFLEDGQQVKGFICEPWAINDAEEITHLKSWRTFIDRKQ